MKEVYRTIFTLVALYASLKLALPYLDVITYAAISVTLFYPIYDRLKGASRRGAALFCTLLVFAAVIVPASYAASFVFRQSREAYSFLVVEELLPPVPALTEFLETPKLELLQQNLPAVDMTISLLAKLPNLLVKLLLFSFLTYYFFYEGTKMKKFMKRALGGFGSTLVEKGETHLQEVVFGNFLTNLLIASISVLLLKFFGVPYAYAVGALVGVAAIAPLVAVWMVLLPLAYVYHQTKPLFAFLMVLYSVMVGGGLFDVFVRNRFVKGIHPAIFTLGFFGGLSLFGVAGMFMGPVILSLSIAVVDTYTLHKKG